MPALTYLSDARVDSGRTVPGDKECDDLLQELRSATGEDWIVLTYQVIRRRRIADVLLGRAGKSYRDYTLYADCHGEWQIINCITREGGTLFHPGEASREAIMNYMLGYVAGLPRREVGP